MKIQLAASPLARLLCHSQSFILFQLINLCYFHSIVISICDKYVATIDLSFQYFFFTP